MKVAEHWFEDVQLRIPGTDRTRTVKRMVVRVIREDGRPVDKTWNILSEKLATQIKSLYDQGILPAAELQVTMRGSGTARVYEVSY